MGMRDTVLKIFSALWTGVPAASVVHSFCRVWSNIIDCTEIAQ
jgi:hypothetical protein